MTHKQLGEFLQEIGMPSEHIMTIADVILWSEMGRYGAVDDQGRSVAEMYNRADQLILGIEQGMPRAG